MIRIILLLLLAYLAYRLLRRLIRLFITPRPPKKTMGPGPVVDQMKPCAHCGTFNPSRHAVHQKGLYFCNKRCLKAYSKAQ